MKKLTIKEAMGLDPIEPVIPLPECDKEIRNERIYNYDRLLKYLIYDYNTCSYFSDGPWLDGFCLAVNNIGMDINDHLPELFSFKPVNANSFWFPRDLNTIRIQIVCTIIRDLKGRRYPRKKIGKTK